MALKYLKMYLHLSRQYWYLTLTSGVTYPEAEIYCCALHAQMSPAEMEEPGEYTAVISSWINTATIRSMILFIRLPEGILARSKGQICSCCILGVAP